jgi:hypothetical protein
MLTIDTQPHFEVPSIVAADDIVCALTGADSFFGRLTRLLFERWADLPESELRMINRDLAQQIVALLNDACALDRRAVQALVDHRVETNTDMAQHPTIQCGLGDGLRVTLGTLGLLNGLAGVDDDGWGAIAAVYEKSEQPFVGEPGTSRSPGVLVGFRLVTDADKHAAVPDGNAKGSTA